MGTLIYNSGLPEELRTNHFADINGQWIEKINDPRCAAVVGAFAYLTYERLLTVSILTLDKNIQELLS
jgi:hypothetical protein